MVNEACNLERGAKEYGVLPCDAQVRKLVGHVRNKIPKEFIKEVEATTKAKAAARIDLYCPLDNFINVMVIQTSDGAADHAIAMVKLSNGRPLVFDSNDPFAMRLNLKTMNHCSGHYANYAAIRYHIRIRFKRKNIENKR